MSDKMFVVPSAMAAPLRPRPNKSEIKKRRDSLQAADEALDVAVGRLMRWAKRVDDLRKKKKRLTRELAKQLANS